MTALRLDAISKGYTSGSTVIDRVSLDVAAGEIFALLGPSGSGKTTLVKMIAGFEEPDRGGIEIAGQSCLGQAPERRGAVLVFQDLLLFPHLSVTDNIGFGLKMRGMTPADRSAKVTEMIALLQLHGLGGRKPSELSGGQQQRVALARALAVSPDILLLDEPMSGLDQHLREEMGQTILDLQSRTGVTIILITHDQAEAATMADRIGVLREGRLEQVGPPRELYNRPASAAVAQFLGGRNFIPGQVRSGIFESGLGHLALPETSAGPTWSAAKGLLTIRPEAVRLAPAAGMPLHENCLSAQVTATRFTGTAVFVTTATEGQSLYVALSPQDAAGLQPGDAVKLHLPAAARWVVPNQA